MPKKVTMIPPSLDLRTSESIANTKKRRVAGYARVSTELDEQVSSYEAQMDYYKNWIFVNELQ